MGEMGGRTEIWGKRGEKWGNGRKDGEMGENKRELGGKWVKIGKSGRKERNGGK